MRENLGSSGREYVNTSSVDSPTLQTLKIPAPQRDLPLPCPPPRNGLGTSFNKFYRLSNEAKFQD